MFTELKDDFFTGDLDEKITYTPKGGSAVTIDAVINEDFPEQDPYVRGLTFGQAVVEVHNSDVSSPQFGDTYTFHGYTWDHKTAQRTADFWSILVVREPS